MPKKHQKNTKENYKKNVLKENFPEVFQELNQHQVSFTDLKKKLNIFITSRIDTKQQQAHLLNDDKQK